MKPSRGSEQIQPMNHLRCLLTIYTEVPGNDAKSDPLIRRFTRENNEYRPIGGRYMHVKWEMRHRIFVGSPLLMALK